MTAQTDCTVQIPPPFYCAPPPPHPPALPWFSSSVVNDK